MEVIRKTGRSVDLASVLLSIFYEVVVDHNDYQPRYIELLMDTGRKTLEKSVGSILWDRLLYFSPGWHPT